MAAVRLPHDPDDDVTADRRSEKKGKGVPAVNVRQANHAGDSRARLGYLQETNC